MLEKWLVIPGTLPQVRSKPVFLLPSVLQALCAEARPPLPPPVLCSELDPGGDTEDAPGCPANWRTLSLGKRRGRVTFR